MTTVKGLSSLVLSLKKSFYHGDTRNKEKDFDFALHSLFMFYL
jgi:hypothetical protein